LPPLEATDLTGLLEPALRFREELAQLRKLPEAAAIPWYPYDSLSNLWTLDRVLTGGHRDLVKLAGERPVLDIGCGDGDLAFFLESIGCKVQAIDNPVTNFNAMQGVKFLKSGLKSAVRISIQDLDAQFALDESDYGLVLLLGVLYHLKNPYYVLETLARHARYCLISTAITGYVPGSYEAVGGLPIAFLPEVYEVNQDSTNYWLFSDEGFRRLLRRCNWEICEYLLAPVDATGLSTGKIAGLRAFCLVRSVFAEIDHRILYGQGWHAVEADGWRWTERRFAVRVELAARVSLSHFRLRIFVPEAVGKIGLRAIVNGIGTGQVSYSTPGAHAFECKIPDVLSPAKDLRIDFELDSAIPPSAEDPRERGIIVTSCECETKLWQS
jgi:SAM-dependent methyltransferase